METFEEAAQIIHREIVNDDPEIRNNFLRLFASEEKEFSEAMARAVQAWRSLDQYVTDNKSQYVWGLVHAAISLHISSMKLLLSGHVVAAGNLFRQVIESMCLAFLCANKDLSVLSQFMNDQYSSSKAVRQAIANWEKLGLNDGAYEQLKVVEDFYHKYSHITRLTLANLIPSSGPGAYVGAVFDEGKVDGYREEVHRRLEMARVFYSFVAGVKKNLSKWETK
ncbi:MAG: hypothetical protein AB2651_02525 [Candidatus Thiodiazotropha sp.]